MRENHELVGQGQKIAAELHEAREAVWQENLASLLRKLRKKEAELKLAGKSEDWKLAVASVLKTRTTVTNRWLATALHLGNLYEVSRKVSAWTRQPDLALLKEQKRGQALGIGVDAERWLAGVRGWHDRCAWNQKLEFIMC